MHYSNPVPVMTMLEVIYTEETSQEAVDIMCTVGEAQDKAISLVRDMPGTYGFILNRVFAAAAREGAPLTTHTRLALATLLLCFEAEWVCVGLRRSEDCGRWDRDP